jgi:hypothetical protein
VCEQTSGIITQWNGISRLQHQVHTLLTHKYYGIMRLDLVEYFRLRSIIMILEKRYCVEQVDPAYLRKQPLPALLCVPSVVSRNLVTTAA